MSPASDKKPLALDGNQHKQLVEAFGTAFLRTGELEDVVYSALKLHLNQLTGEDNPLPIMISEVIHGAQARGMLSELILAALDSRPGNPALRIFAEQAELPLPPVPIIPLQPQPKVLFIVGGIMLLALVVILAVVLPGWNRDKSDANTSPPLGRSGDIATAVAIQLTQLAISTPTVAASITAVAPMTPLITPPPQRLLGITLNLYHALDRARVTQLLRRLRYEGANAISIIPHQYSIIRLDPGSFRHDVQPVPTPLSQHADQYIFSDSDEASTMNLGLFGNTTPLEDVRWICQQARDLGFQVMLKPHLDPLYWHSSGQYYPAGWRGNMELADANVPLFLISYLDDYLGPYVTIAKDLKLPLFCIGVEFVQITRDQGTAFWLKVANGVIAQGYEGDLAYSANWGYGADAEFVRLENLWRHPRMRYIALNAYWNLWPIQLTTESLQGGWTPVVGTRDADPSLDQLVQGWTQPVRSPEGTIVDQPAVLSIQNMSRITGKPILFTEIGYSNRVGAAWDPGRDGRQDDQIDDPTAPGSLQERLFKAFAQVWGPRSDFAGYFWWEASLNPVGDPRTLVTHNILGTYLEQRVFSDFPPAP